MAEKRAKSNKNFYLPGGHVIPYRNGLEEMQYSDCVAESCSEVKSAKIGNLKFTAVYLFPLKKTVVYI